MLATSALEIHVMRPFFLSVNHSGTALNISTMVIRFCAEIHGSERTNPAGFGDPLTLYPSVTISTTYLDFSEMLIHLQDG